jgi:hypothetical protein
MFGTFLPGNRELKPVGEKQRSLREKFASKPDVKKIFMMKGRLVLIRGNRIHSS